MSSKVTVRGSLQDLDEKRPIPTTKRQRTNLVSADEEMIQRLIRGHRPNKLEKTQVHEEQCDTQTQSVLDTEERTGAQRS